MRRIGRYVLHDEIASGGMGAVHLGRALGDAGFARIVAIKRLHSHVAAAPEALAMFMDEARLSARVRHPNVVATLDVVDHEGEMLLVMEYVPGAPLAVLARAAKSAQTPIPIGISVAIVVDVLSGLQAVHDATGEDGEPLHIVHRDVSPQNILVGASGSARLLDFGIAKAASRLQTTRDGHLKGKLRYMAAEQISNQEASPRTDAYSAAVVLYELLTGTSLFDAANEGTILARVLEGVVIPPRRYSEGIPQALEDVVMRGLSRKPEDRFASCREMATALRSAVAPAHADEVSRWVHASAGEALRDRADRVARVEAGLAEGESPAVDVAESRTRTVISPSAPPASPPPQRTKRNALALVLGMAIAGGAVAGAQAYRRGAPSSVAPSASGESAPLPPPVALSASVERRAAAAPSASAPPELPTRTVRAAPRPRPPVTAAPRLRPQCDPMFTVDENGIRRVKSECL